MSETGPKTGRVIAVVVVAVLAVAALIDGASGGGTNAGVQDAATTNCHTAIKDQLTAPATAHFHNETIGKINAGGWSLTGVVDSENAFGALLSSTFSCDTYADGTIDGEPYIMGG